MAKQPVLCRGISLSALWIFTNLGHTSSTSFTLSHLLQHSMRANARILQIILPYPLNYGFIDYDTRSEKMFSLMVFWKWWSFCSVVNTLTVEEVEGKESKLKLAGLLLTLVNINLVFYKVVWIMPNLSNSHLSVCESLDGAFMSWLW